MKKILYSRAKVYIVPTITDTNFYNKIGLSAINIPHFKSNLPYTKVSSKSKQVLCVGRFTSVKQHLILLNIWKSIVFDYDIKDWKLILVGDGEDEVSYRDFINQHNLSNYIKIYNSQKK